MSVSSICLNSFQKPDDLSHNCDITEILLQLNYKINCLDGIVMWGLEVRSNFDSFPRDGCNGILTKRIIFNLETSMQTAQLLTLINIKHSSRAIFSACTSTTSAWRNIYRFWLVCKLFYDFYLRNFFIWVKILCLKLLKILANNHYKSIYELVKIDSSSCRVNILSRHNFITIVLHLTVKI